MFGRKNTCRRCKSKVSDSFDFCPYCGVDLRNPEKDMEEYGLLGKRNELGGYPLVGGLGGLGISDRMLNSLFKSLVKTLDKQMKDISEVKDMDTRVENLPNGVRISIGSPKDVQKKSVKKGITREQISRMSNLPRVEAKTNIRRLGDRVVYELKAPGIGSVEDVFVSKLERGYELKAIGKKKVYVNSLPVNLPLRGYKVDDKGLNVEFRLQ
jgi:hypothetical protein